MSAQPDAFDEALQRARAHTMEWLASVPSRPVGPSMNADDLRAGFAAPLPEQPTDPAEVIDELARLAEPGLMAMPSGRFFGWVIGGTLPAALAADWLVSAWDQNAGMRFASPAVAAAEEAAAGWLLDLLHLPPGADVGFTTGGTTANFVGVAAGRQAVLDRAGWDLAGLGLFGAPRIRVFAGAERHDVIDLVLRYLGLGAPILVDADGQGRIRPDALAAAMDAGADPAGPAIVCLQAGNLHSGAFDPMQEAIAVAHERGAWVHVDGAFGLWAAASPRYREALAGLDLADSWATDGHKTLNVPYDCGMAIVARPDVVRAAFGVHTSYLITDSSGPGDPFDKVPELSRRARGVTVWAALRSLGRAGTVALVERLVDRAAELATGIARIPGAEVLNDVVFTQVSVSFGDDERTRRVTAALLAGGVAWMSGSRWHGRVVLRISVSNWSTDAGDVALSLAALEQAVASVDEIELS
ncbi:glutamate/tyrosine decarboxylase-like PLP-dependent enzyme [Cryobacterium sp. MP_M5]|uniref:pyridoxal phosphate-dependent decarboxylase family protein n=1 Tax=unclassified Cryobacterium TaxID=2649013 RepID=UPI0018CADFE6|nr:MULTISPECIES: pyridoxal-dependent decarboxylase [unclassified Cryobacterium]MBG6059164.1 glutamate/tyrosine decarboxylase-like PLP-dependent enzyme [Cryobacterium sp. MP_M3]MEC5177458.1 glutamate/tyrosine decarboxylase-like PLP-dependent enzyme [Cryobacterium sp. MP_M5]